jgi:serine/threonine protein kinase
MHDLTGLSIGKYQLTEQLGEGGMAVVYKAYDTRLERDVAVKLIRSEAFSQQELDNVLKRFDREAKTLAKLTHPNIVSIIDYGDFEGHPYLVMPYLPGGTLKQYLGNPMPWQNAVKLLRPIASALAYAHGLEVIHRDIKPANIITTASGEPMLTDFGIAKMLDLKGGETLTRAGVGIGTPEYMSPEQGIGKEVDGRSDIYSLGVVLYELVTGRKPFIADTPMAVVFKQMTDPLPRPSVIVQGIPEEVERVLLKALAKKPADRYQGMVDFATALYGLDKLTRDSEIAVSVTPGTPTVMVENPTGLPSYATVYQVETAPPPKVTPASNPIPAPYVRNEFPPLKRRVKVWPFLVGGGGVITILAVAIGLSSLFAGNHKLDKSTATAIQTQSTLIKKEYTATPIPPTLSTILGIGSTQVSTSDNMVLVYVPAGEFLMGSPEGEGWSEEQPQHTVTLDAYWIDQTEVTNAMYKICIAAGSCTEPYTTTYYRKSQYDDYPVVYVEWAQAGAYCQWAGRQLPTEAQWEKAARGTDGWIYPWGNAAASCDHANYAECKGNMIAVGNYETGKSPYGAYDMAGNVWEWVTDWYDDTYYHSQSEWNNPSGSTSGTSRVVRGGSWISYPNLIRSANRGSNGPAEAFNDIGFRCVFVQ